MKITKIKRVDDKPIVLHVKRKPMIHYQKSKHGWIKGKGVYSVSSHTPRVRASRIKVTGKQLMSRHAERIRDQRSNTENHHTMQGYNPSARKDHSDRKKRFDSKGYPYIKAAELAASSAALDQMEGGQEVREASAISVELTHPMRSAARGVIRYKKQIRQRRMRIRRGQNVNNIKCRQSQYSRVRLGEKTIGSQPVRKESRMMAQSRSAQAVLMKEHGQNIKSRVTCKRATTFSSQKFGKRTSKNLTKDVPKKVSKVAAKELSKRAAKIGVKTATVAAGTTVAPGAGTVAGLAAGYAAGVKMEREDAKRTGRLRKLNYFLDKTRAQEAQRDSLGKLVRDLILNRVRLWGRTVAPVVLAGIAAIFLMFFVVAAPVILVTTVLYNSPFALFFPSISEGDTVQSMATEYWSEFQAEITELAEMHPGCDSGEIIYVDYEGVEPCNICDVMAVYMVRFGFGDTATVMNDTNKQRLREVFDDMVSYTTSVETMTTQSENEDGEFSGQSSSNLQVSVNLKTYRDMIAIYDFDEDHVEVLEAMMNSEDMLALGYGESIPEGDGAVFDSLSEEEIASILAGITDSRQRSVLDFALHRVGYPYSQDYRDSGSYFDCSSLAYYAWRNAGTNISFGGATTAAAEAQGIAEAGKTVSYRDLQPGDLIFYSYKVNKRYMNIGHVAIYVGNGKCVEALNPRVGVVYRDVTKQGKIVMIGRP